MVQTQLLRVLSRHISARKVMSLVRLVVYVNILFAILSLVIPVSSGPTLLIDFVGSGIYRDRRASLWDVFACSTRKFVWHAPFPPCRAPDPRPPSRAYLLLLNAVITLLELALVCVVHYRPAEPAPPGGGGGVEAVRSAERIPTLYVFSRSSGASQGSPLEDSDTSGDDLDDLV